MTSINTQTKPSWALGPIALKQWTVPDYHRLSALGLLAAHERTELLAGHITLMTAKGTLHVLTLRLLSQELDALLAEQPVFVSTQDPIQLDNWSEPEPDLAIIRGTPLEYAAQHPRPDQVDLIVEVADTTLKQDCEIKAQIYAQAGITDYWVLAPQPRQLHIFRDPTPTGYTRHLILTEPNPVSPLAFPQLIIDLTAILPPAIG